MCGTHARPWRRGYPGTFAYGGSSRATVVPLAIAPAWPGPDRRVRHYRLTYADGSRENVAGTTSVLAVAARTRVDRPVEIHDLTESAAWLAQRRGAREAK